MVAFADNLLTNVTIPAGDKYIGHGAVAWNQLTSMTIGANVELASNVHANAFTTFATFYDRSGKKAGVYTYTGGNWSYRAR
jgi:hypothetical protein